MYIKERIKEWYKHRHPEYVMNINQDLTDKNQKRVLLCYIKAPFKINFDNTAVFHPNLSRCVQMVTSLTRLGFAVDVCDYNDMDVLPVIEERNYFAIIGFGPLYESICERKSIPNRIIYVTENDPRLLVEKYQERKNYFHQRHPEIKKIPTSDRIQYYTARQFELSNKAIIMTSECNSLDIRRQIPNFLTIKVNGLKNNQFVFSNDNINERRKNFLWFGSTGYIQKGLDILIDVFRGFPNYNLNIYGLPDSETKQLLKLNIPQNIHFCGMVSVQSHQFVDLIEKHLYIISASCMEGMQSGVATCMRHGLIPILTKECGYEKDAPVVIVNDYKVESITQQINTLCGKSDNELGQMSERVYNYAEKNHTLESFTCEFSHIIKEMLIVDGISQFVE